MTILVTDDYTLHTWLPLTTILGTEGSYYSHTRSYTTLITLLSSFSLLGFFEGLKDVLYLLGYTQIKRSGGDS